MQELRSVYCTTQVNCTGEWLNKDMSLVDISSSHEWKKDFKSRLMTNELFVSWGLLLHILYIDMTKRNSTIVPCFTVGLFEGTTPTTLLLQYTDRCCSSFAAVSTHINSEPMHSWLGVDTVIVFIALDWNDIESNVAHRSFVGGKLGLLPAL